MLNLRSCFIYNNIDRLSHSRAASTLRDCGIPAVSEKKSRSFQKKGAGFEKIRERPGNFILDQGKNQGISLYLLFVIFIESCLEKSCLENKSRTSIQTGDWSPGKVDNLCVYQKKNRVFRVNLKNPAQKFQNHSFLSKVRDFPHFFEFVETALTFSLK